MKKITLLIIFLVSYSHTFSQIEVTPQELSRKLSPQELKLLYLIKTDKLKRDEFSRDKNFNNYIENSKLDDIFKAAFLKKIILTNKNAKDFVIYGRENRSDINETHISEVQKNSLGVFLIVKDTNLIQLNDSTYKLKTSTLRKDINLCESERFVFQPSIKSGQPICTGFAIGKNHILSANHCINGNSFLNELVFIFDFKEKEDGSFNTIFKKSQILTPVARVKYNRSYDYAVVKVKEQIKKERILKLNLTDKVKNSQSVYTIGHPYGLPVKIADSAWVTYNKKEKFFYTNLDTFRGNSGSPVFNSDTNLVEGILKAGNKDFKLSNGCLIVNSCLETGCTSECRGDQCYGEKVSRISEFKNKLLPFISDEE
ncbi:Serine protease (modular protein) [Tenacibaculum sp. 190524A05c]|uniref:trypsin-like serine peptidase n=1 Tax=Tenacibaculum platacis TaxID=3137852 RepID=UPI0031FAB257